MLSPSMYSPSRSLHLSMRIFHCSKQCCRSSSDSLFMSSVAFAFTASTDLNLVPFNADLIFGNNNKKKSHGARSGEHGGCSNTVILCFVKNVLTDRVLCASAMSWWRTREPFFHISGLLLTCSWRFVKWFNLQAPNPCEQSLRCQEKRIIIALNLDLLCRAFFCLGELELFQCVDWRLISGSYWKETMIHHKLLHSLKSVGYFQCFEESAQMSIRISFCSGVRSIGTIFEHTFFMLKLLCKICRTVSLSVLINSATSWMRRWWFCWTVSPTFSMLASVFDVLGWPRRR